ncbi:MAG: hypothetical protein Q6M54_00625 [Thermostichus sp. DRC_bins_24]
MLLQDLKEREVGCPQQLAQRLRAEYENLRKEQERLKQLNRFRGPRGRRLLKVPEFRWTDEHAIVLTAKLVPMLLGVEVMDILPEQVLLVKGEGSCEVLGIRVGAQEGWGIHLKVGKPPRSGHRLPLLGALARVLQCPVRPEIRSACLQLRQLREIYPPGAWVRDRQIQLLFSPAQLEALEQLLLVARFGRVYRLR